MLNKNLYLTTECHADAETNVTYSTLIWQKPVGRLRTDTFFKSAEKRQTALPDLH